MNGAFWTSYVALWALVLLLLVLVLLLYRQYGITFMGPRRRIELGGLDLGATAPPIVIRYLGANPREVRTDWREVVTRSTTKVLVALFAAPTCPICKALYADVGVVSERWSGVEFIWVDREIRDEPIPAGWQLVLSDDASQIMELPAFPYAYVLSPKGRVETKGLVNSTGDINRLVTSVLGKTTTPDLEIEHAIP